MNRRLSDHLSLHAGTGYVWASGWAREATPEIANRLGAIWLPGEAKLRMSCGGLLLDLYAAFGMGYLEERQLTSTVEQAQPMWRGGAFSHRESIGARIGFQYRPRLVTGVALEVSFASTVRSGWPNVETTLSVYSESLP